MDGVRAQGRAGKLHQRENPEGAAGKSASQRELMAADSHLEHARSQNLTHSENIEGASAEKGFVSWKFAYYCFVVFSFNNLHHCT